MIGPQALKAAGAGNQADADWLLANQRFLAAELNRLKGLVSKGQQIPEPPLQPAVAGASTRPVDRGDGGGAEDDTVPPSGSIESAIESAIESTDIDGEEMDTSGDEAVLLRDSPPAIDVIGELFGLTAFERDLLLMTAGVEMDADFARCCSRALGQTGMGNATFGLALDKLDQPHWSALTPDRPLRYWQLLTPVGGLGLVASPLQIDERILHYLVGINQPDARISGFAKHQPPNQPPIALMAPSQQLLAGRILETLKALQGGSTLPGQVMSKGGSGQDAATPEAARVLLTGTDASGQLAVAAEIAAQQGARLFVAEAESLPDNQVEAAGLARLWRREARLLPALWLIRWQAGGQGAARALDFAAKLDCQVILAGREPLASHHPLLHFVVDKPDAEEQHQLWTRALGARGEAMAPTVAAVAGQFRFSASDIDAAAKSLSAGEQAGGTAPASESALASTMPSVTSASGANSTAPSLALADINSTAVIGGIADRQSALWQTSLTLGRPGLDDLAQRIQSRADWSSLVLPEPQRQMLSQIAAQVASRQQVYQDWGFAGQGLRGLGISALFSGASGTGKTLAAEVLATSLALDLYRIDLSAVVSKYIGETEKNLRRVFDGAEDSGAILLFDEADALFGKRSEVKDSHDRYANIEVSYLLQRMEAYRGLAILTTNLQTSLDPAFQRRLRFVVAFPFPDRARREIIWQQIFPRETPTKGLDYPLLANLRVAGGSIRNIALNGAFLAASAGQPVTMGHLLAAAHSELAKLDQPLSAAEIRGWV